MEINDEDYQCNSGQILYELYYSLVSRIIYRRKDDWEKTCAVMVWLQLLLCLYVQISCENYLGWLLSEFFYRVVREFVLEWDWITSSCTVCYATLQYGCGCDVCVHIHLVMNWNRSLQLWQHLFCYLICHGQIVFPNIWPWNATKVVGIYKG